MLRELYFVNSTLVTILGIIIAVMVIAVVVLSVLLVKRHNATKNKPSNDVRGTASIVRQEKMTRDGDNFVLARNVIYSVGDAEDIIAGQYEVRCANSSDNSMNIRYNGLVQPYTSGTYMYLTEGDTISPVSESIVIRLV